MLIGKRIIAWQTDEKVVCHCFHSKTAAKRILREIEKLIISEGRNDEVI